MRADLNNFWWTWEPTRRTFEKFVPFFWAEKNPNSQPKFLFVNLEFFFCQKKKGRFFFESTPCWLPGPPKIIQIGPHPEWRKIFGFLLGSACMDMHGKQEHYPSKSTAVRSTNTMCSNFEMMPQKAHSLPQDLSHLATLFIGAHRSRVFPLWFLVLMAQAVGDIRAGLERSDFAVRRLPLIFALK